MTGSGYPGESAGMLSQLRALAAHRHRHAVARLRSVGDAAAARARLRDHRRRRHQAPDLLRARIRDRVPGEQVLDPKVAHELVQLMEQVVEKGGTATRASLVGYRVSGKTGTAFKSMAGGYSTDRIHGGVRGPGAGVASETRDGGGDRRAEQRLREASCTRAATVAAPVFRQRDVGRAAPHGRAAGRFAERARGDAGAGERTP